MLPESSTVKISIHAPLRGRLGRQRGHGRKAYFNPRPLAGATGEQCKGTASRLISIHAPLRGRRSCRSCPGNSARFQSTPPCGGDLYGRKKEVGSNGFQSTPPCGGDGIFPGGNAHPGNFNPRPLAGATTGLCNRRDASGDFNPRPLAGATRPKWANKTIKTIFQSTPPCGGDGKAACAVPWVSQFQSTPPCGGDCQTGQLEFYKRFRLFSRKSVHGSPKPHFPVLVPSVRFPFALTAPWELLGHRSFWLPGAGFCSDTCFPGCRTASCRGLCQ